jgi:hypothetical protein
MPITDKPTADEAEALTVEHATLVKQQYEALQKAPYIRMPQSEADAYDERRLRIEEICLRLAKYRLC